MRAALAALVLFVSLSACAVASAPLEGPRYGYGPLRAYINPPEYGGLGFHVNRPAHVAMFEVVPGRGASLIYPAPGMGRLDGFVFGGTRTLGSVRRSNADHYLPAMSTGLMSGPRFLFLIASERPLDLAQFGGFGMAMRGTLGVHFASINAYQTMEQLAQMALPSLADDGSWTTDLYVYWPNVLYDSPDRGRVRVACNGYTMYVPLAFLSYVRSTICQAPGQDPQTQPSDSTRKGEDKVVPQRRAPVSETRIAELRERIASSVQLEERRARPELDPRGRSRPTPSDWQPRERMSPRDLNDAQPRERVRPTTERPQPRAAPRAEPRERNEPRIERPRPAAQPERRAEPSVDRRPAPAPQPAPRPASGGSEERCNPCEQL